MKQSITLFLRLTVMNVKVVTDPFFGSHGTSYVQDHGRKQWGTRLCNF